MSWNFVFITEFDASQFIVVVIPFDVQIVLFWGYCEPLYVDFILTHLIAFYFLAQQNDPVCGVYLCSRYGIIKEAYSEMLFKNHGLGPRGIFNAG